MPAEVGKKIPAFAAKSDTGPFTAADLSGRVSVIYFYPKDNTPGCTTQACEFKESFPDFKKLDVAVFGVSKDTLQSHQKFRAKFALPFTLVSDEDGSMCEAFGVWIEKSMYGKKYMGIERSTFVIGADGTILNEWRKVRPAGHADTVLEFIKSL
jgi:peroxiredoxin Q/BCP